MLVHVPGTEGLRHPRSESHPIPRRKGYSDGLLGLLGVLAVAPMVFEWVGPAMGVALCGGVITLQGVWTLARGRGRG